MNLCTVITFRNVDRSPALVDRIESEVGKLRRHVPELSRCEAMVEILHRHHRFGHHYKLHLTLRLRGIEVVVSHEPSARRAIAASDTPDELTKRSETEATHHDAYLVIHEGFAVARRRLEDVLRRDRDRRRTTHGLASPRNDEAAVASCAIVEMP